MDSKRTVKKATNKYKKVSKKKEWCIYRYVYPSGIGRVTKITKSGAVVIRYSDGQFYPEEYWNPDYVWFYDTLQEAMEEYSKWTGESVSMIEKRVRQKFPKEFKNADRKNSRRTKV